MLQSTPARHLGCNEDVLLGSFENRNFKKIVQNLNKNYFIFIGKPKKRKISRFPKETLLSMSNNRAHNEKPVVLHWRTHHPSYVLCFHSYIYAIASLKKMLLHSSYFFLSIFITIYINSCIPNDNYFFKINREKSVQLNLERSVESVETSSKY